MKRLPVVLREEAIADLEEIYRYIAEKSGNTQTAWQFILRIKDRCERIGDVPQGGRARDDLMPGLRIAPFERSAVIAYRITEARVSITNIFYGGRDYETLIGGSPEEDD